MNPFYIAQRAFQHIADDRTLTDAEVLACGRILNDANPQEQSTAAEFARYLDLIRKDKPSIEEEDGPNG